VSFADNYQFVSEAVWKLWRGNGDEFSVNNEWI